MSLTYLRFGIVCKVGDYKEKKKRVSGMQKAQRDSVFGMVKESYPIFEDAFDEAGRIYVCEGGLVFKYKDKYIRAPADYVRKLEKVDELPLGKVSVILKIFDQTGLEHDMAVGINDMHYISLKKLCPNAEPKQI